LYAIDGGRCEFHKKPKWFKRDESPNRLRGRKLQALRASIFRTNPLCAECERQGFVSQSQELDHIIPLFEGGTNQRENMQGLCKACHKLKTQAEAKRARYG
jgi:5-methylcytosine-specific restriction protein A